MILDLDNAGCLIGIEVLEASKNIGKELAKEIAHTEKRAAAA